jgi:Tol biopolymer transport system component
MAADGRSFVYAVVSDARQYKIVRVSLPSGESRTIADHLEGGVAALAISPDQRVAFSMDPPQGENGPRRLFVISATGGTPEQVQVPSDHTPANLTWSPDGKQLGYISGGWKKQFFALSNFLPQPQQNGQ